MYSLTMASLFLTALSTANGAGEMVFLIETPPNMLETKVELQSDVNPQETSEWMEALDGVVEENGPERAAYLLGRLIDAAAKYGVETPHKLTTPYVNTIPVEEEGAYPGDRALDRRIKSLLRWNAMAMVV